MSSENEKITLSPQVVAEQQKRAAFAKQVVSTMPGDLRADLSGWAKLMTVWHTGADFRGDRITGEARRALRRNLDMIEKNLVGKYLGDEGSFSYLVYKPNIRLDISEVRDELANYKPEEDK